MTQKDLKASLAILREESLRHFRAAAYFSKSRDVWRAYAISLTAIFYAVTLICALIQIGWL